ncbi:hypothetical protein F5Y09DRAFT_351775 [Xylaria sp. FL1042]|nr:hypothetical protein F5Y09DRAFT_351775 [Xylaria sp. FL1042]
MADPYPTVLSRIRATKECALEWIRDLEEIRPPHEVFEEEVQLLEDNIHQERQHILSGLNHEQLSSSLDRVVQYSGQLKGLQLTYDATADEQETTYQESLQSHLESLAGDIINTLGITLVEKVLHSAKAVPQPSPVLTQPTDSGSVISPDRDHVTKTPPRDFPRQRKRGRPASKESREPPQKRLRSNSNRAEEPSIGIVGRRQSKRVDAITDPTPGNVYLGYWPKSRSWLAVLLLPLGNFGDIGLSGTIADTGLLHDVPPCYRYSRRAKAFRGWQDGFEDGGQFVVDRQFPVIYFDDSFPGGSVGWMPAKNLKIFDPEDPSVFLIPNHGPALDFLKQRDTDGGRETQQESASAEIDENQGPRQLQANSRSKIPESRSNTPSEATRSCIILSGSESDSEEVASSINSHESSQGQNQDQDQEKSQEQDYSQEHNQSQGQDEEQSNNDKQNQEQVYEQKHEQNQDQEQDQSQEQSQDQNQNKNQDPELGAFTTALHHAAPNRNDAESYQNENQELDVIGTGPQHSAHNRNGTPINQNQNDELEVLSSDQRSGLVGHSDSVPTSSLHSQGCTEFSTMEMNQSVSGASNFPSAKQTRSSKKRDSSTVFGFFNTPKLTKAALGALGLLDEPIVTECNPISDRFPYLSNRNQIAVPKAIENVSETGPLGENIAETNPKGDAAHILNLIRERNLKVNLQQAQYPPMSAAPLPSSFKSQATPPWLPEISQNPDIASPVMQPLVGGLPSPIQPQVHTAFPHLAPGSQGGRETSTTIAQQRSTARRRVSSTQAAYNQTVAKIKGQRISPIPNLGLLSPPQTITHDALTTPKTTVDSLPKLADTNSVPSHCLSMRPNLDSPKSIHDSLESVSDKPKPFFNTPKTFSPLYRNAEGLYICIFCRREFHRFRSMEEHVEKNHPQEYQISMVDSGALFLIVIRDELGAREFSGFYFSSSDETLYQPSCSPA